MICECGTLLVSTAKFCTKCGKEVAPPTPKVPIDEPIAASFTPPTAPPHVEPSFMPPDASLKAEPNFAQPNPPCTAPPNTGVGEPLMKFEEMVLRKGCNPLANVHVYQDKIDIINLKKNTVRFAHVFGVLGVLVAEIVKVCKNSDPVTETYYYRDIASVNCKYQKSASRSQLTLLLKNNKKITLFSWPKTYTEAEVQTAADIIRQRIA